MKTSIIILTYNELELTKKCLASIERYTDKDKIELIIVDNGSSDGTREYISNLPDVKVILNEKTSGSPRGNQGIEAAGEKICCF
ncbi:glycosyltransferase family 2 protein [Bacillus velezensis]|uniref:glycosyltransferase family 2 protein n=1 Tax=Bacillus velezensis TaxID=492670 RepID=UPI002DDCD5A4|nr:glycosyltransferase [Bacillus velezensis]